MVRPGWSGTAIVSPAWLSARASVPGPVASIMIRSIPAILRFHTPFSGWLPSCTCSSHHNRLWCEKNTPSPGARRSSAAGTYIPETWHELWPNWILAMSLIAGWASHRSR